MRFTVRPSTAADDQPLREIMERCPEEGAVTLGFEMRDSVLRIPAELGTRHHYSVQADDGRVVGMGFLDVGEVLVAGQRRRGGYLSFLRTHPDWRRRGVASVVIARRVEQALGQHGADLVWAGIIRGNAASYRTLRAAGFRVRRGCRLKLVMPGRQRAPRGTLGSVRPARVADVPWIADRLDAAYGHLDLWPALDAGQRVAHARGVLRALQPDASDPGELVACAPRVAVWVLADDRDRPRASLFIRDFNGIAVPKVLRVRPLFRLVNVLVGIPAMIGQPLRSIYVNDVAAAPGDEAAALELVRAACQHYQRQCEFFALNDLPGTPSGFACRRLKGFGLPLDLAHRGPLGLDARRPVFMQLA